MRLPWSNTSNATSADQGPVSKSQAALSGPEGDGKEHDLQYWLDSGFLTLPKNGVDVPAATPARATPRPAK